VVSSETTTKRDEKEAPNAISKIRTYDIETHFTIEPRSFYEEEASQADNPSTVRAPSKPMKGLMTTYGYLLPDPQNPVRYTVWFTGGTVAPKVEPDPAAAKLSSSTTKQS
jgi:hypothetical protein